MTTPNTLLNTVANAIATADVDGATYEDLARAALKAHDAWKREEFRTIAAALNCDLLTLGQEDDGA